MSEQDADQDLREVVASLSEQVINLSASLAEVRQGANDEDRAGQNTGLDAERNEQQVKNPALEESLQSGYDNAVRSEKLLLDAGYADATSFQPKFIELTREARKAAIRMSAASVTTGESGYGDAEDDVIEDRGKGAQAELPPGVPDWPPRPFLARQKVFTKPWHIWLLKQGDSVRNDADPRIAEGDCLSNVVLWLDYATITMRLLGAAIKAEDYTAVVDLIEQTSAYQAAAYDAARMRVDDVSMNILNKPAAELYMKTTQMNLETTTMRVPGLKFLRESNAAMLTAKAKAIANKAAAVPSGNSDSSQGNNNSGKKSKSKRTTAHQDSAKQGNSKAASKTNDNTNNRPTGAPQAAASSASTQEGRATAAGGQ